ncbi:hypothetical protein FB45DRAFT_1070954 [Roridomyces roridus]|uniref:F-box domain-containing protein n=1 Tax=Roridomyces roridus TaxID=1738132 RepID=A0AAD7AY69_9AGAR|nr:hypothetical protein FB45DRAFT_1070954 [Roridomyces roridus]
MPPTIFLRLTRNLRQQWKPSTPPCSLIYLPRHILSLILQPRITASLVTSNRDSQKRTSTSWNHSSSVKNFIALSVDRAAELQRAIEAHKAIISPIRRLPNELLAEIFFQASQASFDRMADIGPTKAPWLFTHVCQLWAEVALGSRALWSRIFMHLDRVDEAAGGFASIAKLFFERSGNFPLTVKYSANTVIPHIVHSTPLWNM